MFEVEDVIQEIMSMTLSFPWLFYNKGKTSDVDENHFCLCTASLEVLEDILEVRLLVEATMVRKGGFALEGLLVGILKLFTLST